MEQLAMMEPSSKRLHNKSNRYRKRAQAYALVASLTLTSTITRGTRRVVLSSSTIKSRR